ncbi:MAG: alpha-amylase family glycosyl hydrolase [Phototrophicaceae bacterium]
MKKLFLSILLFTFLGTIVPITAQETEFREPNWWEERVWYLLFVRSFYDSDGDGIGDIQGIIEKLDYLNDGDPNTNDDLGITGIWLLPIAEAESYHGYDAVDYRSVEQDYGTADDFRQLMDEAHARGINVVVDYVINHTSDEHPWFEASESGDPDFIDWYVWEDENPAYNGPWGAQAWYRNSMNEQWYYAPFWSGMPDLNHDNPAVTAEMNDIARFWLEDLGVDGFRLDAIRYVLEIEVDGRPILADSSANRAYLADFNAYVHEVNPDAFTVGEIFVSSNNTIANYTDDGAVDAAFEFPLASDIISAAQVGNKRDIERQVASTLREFGAGDFATFATNHDMARLLSQLGENEGMNRTVANLLMTLPGFPFIYYGDEIGMTSDSTSGGGDENYRRPMQWDESANGGFTTGNPWYPLDDNFADRTVLGQTDDPASLFSHYRNLIHLRNSQPALQYGETILVESTYRAAWGYLRYTEDETLLVVLNLDDRESNDYTFSIEESHLSGVSSIDVLFSTTEVTPSLPEISSTGGFADYVPIDAPLPPFSIYVLRLNS